MESKKLSEIKVGETAVIESFTDEFLKLKLMEMGCVPGERIRVHRLAPLGDPIAVEVADSLISMRVDEAETIFVKTEN